MPLGSEHIFHNEVKYVLVVDDVEINYALIRILLKQLGIVSLWASNGKEAVDQCKNNPDICLVLMDIRMPVMDGYEATGLIKKIRKDLPVIAQTAYVSDADRDKCIEAGCDDYLTKPIYCDQLKEMLIKYLKYTATI